MSNTEDIPDIELHPDVDLGEETDAVATEPEDETGEEMDR